MAKSFDQGVAELLRRVGAGDLTGEVEYDQAYAKRQHEVLEYDHPQGGEAKFLEKAQKATYQVSLAQIAAGALDDGGVEAMEDAVETLVLESSRRAPIGPPDNGDEPLAAKHPGLLRASGHAKVYDNGRLVFDRPGAPREER